MAQRAADLRGGKRYGAVRIYAESEDGSACASARGKRDTHHRVPESGRTRGHGDEGVSVRCRAFENPGRDRLTDTAHCADFGVAAPKGFQNSRPRRSLPSAVTIAPPIKTTAPVAAIVAAYDIRSARNAWMYTIDPDTRTPH